MHVARPEPAPAARPASRLSKARAGKRYASGEVTRIMADWATSDLDADTMILRDAGRTRARTRSLRRDNPYFRRFLAELAANVIGADGIRLKMKVRRANRGRYAGTPDEHANRVIEDAWNEFSRPGSFDATRQLGRAEFSRLALQTIATTGEAPIRFVRGFPKNRWGFAVQGFEPDYLPFEHRREPSTGRARIKASVELDSYGEPTAYHLLKTHPGKDLYHCEEDNERVRVQSESYRSLGGDTLGDSMILPFVREEFAQTRGMSWAATALRQLRQLAMYEEAAVVSARIGASKMFFIQQSELAGRNLDDEEEYEDGSTVMDAQPGTGHKLSPGETLSSWDPNDPNGNYEAFRKGILRGIAAGLLCNYNVLANDLEGVSFSSIRQGVLSERELWKIVQSWWIDHVEGPQFHAWFEMALLSGQLPFPMAEHDRLCCPWFEGRRWDWVDPLKDIKAAREEVLLGTESLQGVARRRGRDLRDVADEMREDVRLAEGEKDEVQLGFSELFLPGGGKPQSAPPAAMPAPDEEEEE